MKKIKILIVLALALMCCVGCNQSLGLGQFSFDKVHILTKTDSFCVGVRKWYEASTGVEVELDDKERTHLWLSEGTYILVGGKCPICGKEKSK